MDDIDKGNYQAELALQVYIDRARRRALEISRPTGFCFNCAEESPGKVFCCPECRDDFEKRALTLTKLNKE